MWYNCGQAAHVNCAASATQVVIPWHVPDAQAQEALEDPRAALAPGVARSNAAARATRVARSQSAGSRTLPPEYTDYSAKRFSLADRPAGGPLGAR